MNLEYTHRVLEVCDSFCIHPENFDGIIQTTFFMLFVYRSNLLFAEHVIFLSHLATVEYVFLMCVVFRIYHVTVNWWHISVVFGTVTVFNHLHRSDAKFSCLYISNVKIAENDERIHFYRKFSFSDWHFELYSFATTSTFYLLSVMWKSRR